MTIPKSFADMENNGFCPLLSRTEYVICYMTGGLVKVWDLADSKIPLPRWRSLTVINHA